MNSTAEEKFALRELDDNVAWMRSIFQHYLTWYTFFVTANLFALSWVFTGNIRRSAFPLAILFLFLNACGTITAVLLARYIVTADRRNRALLVRLNTLAGLENDQAMRPTFPHALAKIGFVFIALGLVGIAVLWGVVATYLSTPVVNGRGHP